MKSAKRAFWLGILISLTLSAQEEPTGVGGEEPEAEAPKRIVLEEKQVSAAAKPVEMKLDDGTQVRLRLGAEASLAKFEMSDAIGTVLQGLRVSDGEVAIECPPDVKLSVWLPDGDADLEGGEHVFAIVKDGWRQICLKPVAHVEEKKTGAKWRMEGEQKARVERMDRAVLITHEKDSTKKIYVAIPAGWIVHTLEGEDLKSEDERLFTGRGIEEYEKGAPLTVPMIVRLDPADAVLILPGELPAAARRPLLQLLAPPGGPAPPPPPPPVSPLK